MQDTDNLIHFTDVSREFEDLRNKYERLKDSHRKLLGVNQSLEDKLLQNINRYETEKYSMVNTISTLTTQLEELHKINQRLVAENERFKLDISVAIQLLHCKPSNFTSCKLENLPPEFQAKAKLHMQNESLLPRPRPKKENKIIRVPISAFPSTTVIYSVPSQEDEDEDEIFNRDTTVPVETMAKILEERQRELSVHANGNDKSPVFNGGLHTSRSMPFLDGHHCVDHGTQTYPSYIGERDRSRNTCIYCQGAPTTTFPSTNSGHNNVPAGDPKVFVYTETETKPIAARNNTLRSGLAAHRRKKDQSAPEASVGTSVETDI